MKDKIKQAHLRRAKELYNDESIETPGSFEEYFQGQYVDEYSKSGGEKKNVNKATNDRYLAMLAQARGNERAETPGLLSEIQGGNKGPYPANKKEDDHLLEQIMKFLYSDKIQDSIFQMMKSAKKNLAELISQTAAGIAGRIIFEVRKRREVTEPVEKAVLRIATEELWTIARNFGLKKIPKQVVGNSLLVAQGMFDQLEKQLKGAPQPQQQQQPQQPPQGLLGGM